MLQRFRLLHTFLVNTSNKSLRLQHLHKRSLLSIARARSQSRYLEFLPSKQIVERFIQIRSYSWWEDYEEENMGPIPSDVEKFTEDLIKSNTICIFSKSWCPFCKKVKEIFSSINAEYFVYELDLQENGDAIQSYLLKKTGQKTVPSVFINQQHIGGASDTEAAHAEGKLFGMIGGDKFDYDLFVLGGGSGGLACSKEAANLGAKVAVADFVTPTPIGTTWGLGGTCVNVGCIPKKLMHQAALLGEHIQDSQSYGWQATEKKHDWPTLVTAIKDHIGSLNWGYKVALRQANVKYYNSLAAIDGPNKVTLTAKNGKVETVSAKNIVLAMGGRPTYPDIPGAKECSITSDDIFSLNYNPGKTLFIGASYIALECAGFLHGFGNDVTVMVRSILLRGFDLECAAKIGDYMESHGIKFLKKFVPVKLEQLKAPTDDTAGEVKVTYQSTDGAETKEEIFNTVCFAVGRHPLTSNMGLDKIGVSLDGKGFVNVDDADATNVKDVYAIGDIGSGIQELTPVAIQAGRLLARRLFGGKSLKCDYVNVPTTVFTPLEYGSCGYSEEQATEKFGAENVEVFHQSFTPLEATIPHKEENHCFTKVVVHKADSNRIVGMHYLGPNAGEVIQGFGIAFKLGATKESLDNLIGIHPTNAEIFTTMDVTKSSGESAEASGC